MAKVTIKKDFTTKLKGDIYIQTQAKIVTELLVATARALARTDAYETGRYMRGIVARGTQMLATDWKSLWIEFGTINPKYKNMTARHILRRAAETHGFTVQGGKK